MTPDVDLLVAGGGPVGLGTAIMAAEAGLRVVVVEPRPGPIDKACGEGLMPGALTALQALGVDPPGRAFHGIQYVTADGARSAQARFRHGPGRGVRRTVLQAALAERAEAVGVRLVADRVDEVIQGSDSVEAGGITARYLVAADGLHSPLRRRLGLQRPAHGQPRYGLRRHYVVAPWTDLVEVHWAVDAEAYVTPVADDLVGVAVLTATRGIDLDAWLRTRFPSLGEHLVGAGPLTAVRGAGPLEQNVSARVVGRVLLVGDAAGYVDALTGEGVAVGLASARAAVAAVLADRPEQYKSGWRHATRRYRVLTRGVLAVSRSPLRRVLVPAAEALPPVFGAMVDSLARA